MNVNTYILDATKTLEPYKTLLEEISKEAIHKTAALIPIDTVDIVLYNNPDEAIEDIALGGYTPSPHVIFLSLNPQKENFEQLIQKHLGRQLAHELHHSLRWRNPGYGTTLFEAMVTEGLADHFMCEVYKGELEEWDKKELLGDRVDEVAKLAKEEYTSMYSHSEWFLGRNIERIPKWSGYVLGYNIISDYLHNHPDQKASTLYSAKAEIFQ